MDVSFLSQVNANALKQVSVKPVSDSGFSAALESAEQHVSPELVTPELLKTFLEDPNSTLPEGIRKSLLALFSDTVLSPKELSVLGKQLSVYASGLAEVVTFSSNPLDVAQADFNLQIVTAGMMTMVDAYGNQHALNDLIGLWKKLDTRTASFENLESNFIEFSKKGQWTCLRPIW